MVPCPLFWQCSTKSGQRALVWPLSIQRLRLFLPSRLSPDVWPHDKSQTTHHFVWVTKYRYHLLQEEPAQYELQLYTKESDKLGCHISIGSGTKEEVFELPKTLEKEVFELYECVGSKTEKQKKMIKINWQMNKKFF